MRNSCKVFGRLLLACVVLLTAACTSIDVQNSRYTLTDGWAHPPAGRKWGSISAADVGPDGAIWVADRCGANSCLGSSLGPVVRLTPTGQATTSFGANMFVFPHGLHVDRDGNVWVADADGKQGKGHQVVKFSPEGKVLLVLGKAGVAGATADTFNRPSAVVTAANGDIFVADGHGGESNARIVHFSKDGKFIKAWGRKGSAPGEFGELHGITIDSAGRLYVADRGNSRVQIFDQSGKFLAEWRQFGRPSGIYVDRHDILYVTDHQSDSKRNPGMTRGIRIGSVSDGVVRAHIPAVGPAETAAAPEGVTADDNGNVYGADVAGMNVRRYARQ